MQTGWSLIRTRMFDFSCEMDRLVMPGRRPLVRALYFLDVCAAFALYGASVSNYFDFEFYKKRHCERQRFITILRAKRIYRFLNDPRATWQLRNKGRFHELFADLTGREYLDPSNCSRDEFVTFARRHKSLMVKPIDGSLGIGVRRVEIAPDGPIEALYTELKANRMIAEEVIRQSEEMASLHPASVNTVRITTVLSDGHPLVMTAALRIGNGMCVTDNFHTGGIVAAIEPETGVAISTGIDGHGKRYVRHPLTEKQIVGFVIPKWHDVVALVESAAPRLPRVRYVGWDVALSEERGPVLVEGNDSGMFDVQQQPDQVGKRDLYDAVLKGMKKLA